MSHLAKKQIFYLENGCLIAVAHSMHRAKQKANTWWHRSCTHTHTHFMAVKHIASEPWALHSSFLSFGLTKPITCHVRMFGSKIVQMTYPFAMGFDLSLPNVWSKLDSLGYLEIARWTKYLSVFCLPSSSCRFFIHISFHKAPIRLLIEHCLIWFFLLPPTKNHISTRKLCYRITFTGKLIFDNQQQLRHYCVCIYVVSIVESNWK